MAKCLPGLAETPACGVQGGAMLSRLKLRDFRCFPALELEFEPGGNVFVGANAQGKTSILEAICVLTRLQSPRLKILSHAIRHDQRGFVVDGYFDRRHLQFYYGRERKKLALDSVEQKSAREYLEVARTVYFSSQDIDIIRGGAELRRRFLDFAGAQFASAYRTHLRAYEKALRSRNRLLKMPSPPRREIAAFTGPLVEAGNTLATLRSELIRALEPFAEASLREISGEAVSLAYERSGGEDLATSLELAQKDDLRRAQTTVGPHRDDLRLILNGTDSLFASEGQQRSLALSLKLAQAALLHRKTGEPPLLLIDDVFGELDLDRRRAFLKFLPPDSQRFITTTHLDWMEEKAGGVFTVQGGKVTR